MLYIIIIKYTQSVSDSAGSCGRRLAFRTLTKHVLHFQCVDNVANLVARVGQTTGDGFGRWVTAGELRSVSCGL